MRHIVTIMMFIILTCSSVFANEDKLYNYNIKTSEAIELANKIETLKKKYYLEYKDKNDLVETCIYITRYAKMSNFNKYDLAAICLRESKFNPKAYNRIDGGKGLFQITNPDIWHRELLPWFNKPYSKEQSTKAAVVVLEKYYKIHKKKQRAIQCYNSSGKKGIVYGKAIQELRLEIKKAKV